MRGIEYLSKTLGWSITKGRLSISWCRLGNRRILKICRYIIVLGFTYSVEYDSGRNAQHLNNFNLNLM
jgi:hypothetical protein